MELIVRINQKFNFPLISSNTQTHSHNVNYERELYCFLNDETSGTAKKQKHLKTTKEMNCRAWTLVVC